jgi:hypothetical protein
LLRATDTTVANPKGKYQINPPKPKPANPEIYTKNIINPLYQKPDT